MNIFANLRQKLKQSRYLRNVAWQMSGNGFAQALGILLMPLLTRLYAPSDFAMLNLFMQVVAGLTILLTWRFEYLVMLPKDDFQAYAILRAIAWFSAAMTIFATLAAGFIGDDLAALLGSSTLAPWLVLAPITAWLICLSIGLQQAVQRRQDFRTTGISEVVGKGGYVASALTGVLWLPQIGGLMASSAISAGAKAFWLLRKLRINRASYSNIAPLHAVGVLKPYVRLAGSMSFSNLLGMITSAVPMIFIAKTYGADTLGQYGLVISTMYLPAGLLGNAIGQVYFQRAAQLYAHGEAFDNLWRTTAWQLARIGVPLYIVVAILSPWAYPFVFGDQWKPAGEYAMLMATAVGLSFITSPLDRTSLIIHAWWYLPLWHAARALTTIAVVWLAWYLQWPVKQFLIALNVQMSALYLSDWLAGRWFAIRVGAGHG
jgi:teichuronic acid exporter